MKCPSCAYENAEDALYCNLCQYVFRKEKPAAPPRPSEDELLAQAKKLMADATPAGGPAKLATADDINALLLAALELGKTERFDEARDLMARLYFEVDPLLCRDMLLAFSQAWAKTSTCPKPDVMIGLELIKVAAEAAGRKDWPSAWKAATPAMHKVKDLTADAFRLQLTLLGLKGAAMVGQAPAAPRSEDVPRNKGY